MIINRVLAFFISIFSLLIVVGFLFPSFQLGKLNIFDLAYLLILINLILLIIASFRFKAENAKSKILAYTAVVLYILAPLSPIFLLILAVLTPSGELNLGKTSMTIVTSLPVIIGAIVTFVVASKLIKSSDSISPSLESHQS